MARARSPKWFESNLMAREGIQNRKTGAVRELARGGKIKLRRADRVDLSVGLARELRSRREVRG